MAKARKLPSGAWRTQATKTINGKKVRKSFTVTLDECGGDSTKAKNLSEKNAREWVLNTEAELRSTTIATAIDLYIKDRSSVLSPSTIADYERMPKHFSELLPLDINDVDTKTIQAVINEMAMNKLNARTIKNRIFFLISALNYVGIDKKFKLRFPSQIKPNLAPPEPTEFKRLLDMATAEEKLTIILSGLYTLRRGEIAGLCGEDLLWDLNSIYVHTSRVQNDKKEWVIRQYLSGAFVSRTIQSP